MKSRAKLPWIEGAFVFGLFIVGLLIRSYHISTLAAYPDELTYASRGIQIVAANWAWPSSQMWDQPPLFTYIIAFFTAAFGASLNSLRMISVLFGSITIVIAYFLGKSMYGRIAGAIGAVGVTFDGFHILYSRLLYIEALANALILCSILLFWEGIVKKKSLKVSILGGIVFGLALDSKYISMVAGVALFVFLVLYSRKIGKPFPGRQVIAYFATSILMYVPVLIDLAVNNANPFYFDLVGRFQQSNVNVLETSIRSGQFFALGFQRFVQVQFHVSSTNPYGAFALSPFQVIAWTSVVTIVLVFFLFSFLKRSMPDGLLLILFAALLAFAFEYPGKRVYFSLYPSLVFMIMLGRVGQSSIQRISKAKSKSILVPLAAVIIISITVIALAVNIAAVPVVYKNGFGDWDEIMPITNYITNYVSINHSGNTSVATDLAVLVFYLELQQVHVQFVSMKQPVYYYNEPPINQTLMVPQKGEYPFYYVLSTTQIEREQPQFIILPSLDYKSTTTNFHTFINERYFQPLQTNLILLFQIRPGNPNSNYTGCC
ncbi:MAG: glycosyltransferase family 39 protein [Nitrososphaerota archaeon]|nr:glycosyltransferase family 39 protein [Nitrososphaerota archaeon]